MCFSVSKANKSIHHSCCAQTNLSFLKCFISEIRWKTACHLAWSLSEELLWVRMPGELACPGADDNIQGGVGKVGSQQSLCGPCLCRCVGRRDSCGPTSAPSLHLGTAARGQHRGPFREYRKHGHVTLLFIAFGGSW